MCNAFCFCRDIYAKSPEQDAIKPIFQEHFLPVTIACEWTQRLLTYKTVRKRSSSEQKNKLRQYASSTKQWPKLCMFSSIQIPYLNFEPLQSYEHLEMQKMEIKLPSTLF